MDGDEIAFIDSYGVLRKYIIDQIYLVLAQLPPFLRKDVTRALEENGKIFSNPDNIPSGVSPVAGSWSLLTLLVAQSICPDVAIDYVSSIAAAIEFFICALDLLDDVEDDDQTPIIQDIGKARTLNASTALIMLSQKVILSLPEQQCPAERKIFLLTAFQDATLIATGGQHRDLLAEQLQFSEMAYEDCIEIATAKAGALMKLACQLGAVCVDADDYLMEQFSKLGELLGIAAQLDNDCHDLYYLIQDQISAFINLDVNDIHKFTPNSKKMDIVRGKKTLPLVLAGMRSPLLQTKTYLVDTENEEYIRALYEGILSAWGVCLLYREYAYETLLKIECPLDPALYSLLGFK